MAKYVKKPIEIEAEQWFPETNNPIVILGNFENDNQECDYCGNPNNIHGVIETLEGFMKVCPGDFIIKGVKEEFYACKQDIFYMTYEKSVT